MIALKTEHAFFQRHVLRPVAGDLVIRYVTIRKNSLRTSVVKKRYNWMSPRESSAMLKSQLWWAAKVSFEFSHGLGLRPPAHPVMFSQLTKPWIRLVIPKFSFDTRPASASASTLILAQMSTVRTIHLKLKCFMWMISRTDITSSMRRSCYGLLDNYKISRGLRLALTTHTMPCSAGEEKTEEGTLLL